MVKHRSTVTRRAVPSAGVGMRGEAGHLAYLLRQASAAVRLELDRALAPLELTLPQYAVLTMIANYAAPSGAELARLAMLTPQTVNLITRNLLRRRAIVQVKHETHGRILKLQPTRAGEVLLKKARTQVAEVEARLERTLPAAHAVAIRAWLVRIAVDFGGSS